MSTSEFRPKSKEIKGQQLPYPARQKDMNPSPDSDLSNYRSAEKLLNKVAIITGGDSGIGRAVAIAYAMEGADVAIVFNENSDDAEETKRIVNSKGRECLLLKKDVRKAAECKEAIQETMDAFGKINILVNNAAFQATQEKIEDISEEQLRRTFETNIFGYFFMAQSCLPHMHAGDTIVNTGSIVGMVGHPILVDYTSSKGAIHAFTKSLALQIAPRGIRVNCVVPGPVWTPNIPGTMPMDEVENFGHEVAMERPGQPEELAPVYVLLGSGDSSFMTGSLVEVTGGKLSNG